HKILLNVSVLKSVISFFLFIFLLGAPRDAVYKFLKCNPTGDRTNCVTHQSPEMEWSPELPGKLPASTAQNMLVFMFLEMVSPPQTHVRWGQPAEQELRDNHLLKL
uniref:Uncharacterized protein n=1 Tax=Cynoglossus semilaevis TaxID=244447 RepID=A0A3P8W8R4_CYNSE